MVGQAIPRVRTTGPGTRHGAAVRHASQASLRRVIDHVAQEPLLSQRPVKDSSACCRPGATDAMVRPTAELARSLDLIERMPDGCDTMGR